MLKNAAAFPACLPALLLIPVAMSAAAIEDLEESLAEKRREAEAYVGVDCSLQAMPPCAYRTQANYL